MDWIIDDPEDDDLAEVYEDQGKKLEHWHGKFYEALYLLVETASHIEHRIDTINDEKEYKGLRIKIHKLLKENMANEHEWI